MDEKTLRNWLDGMAGFIIWAKENEEDTDVIVGVLSHDIHGIVETVFGDMEGFLPRSSNYKKYCPNGPASE